MDCFTFRKNKIAPGETNEKISYMDQSEFIRQYYTNCDINELKNTALLTIGGVGSFDNPRTLKYENDLIIESLEYNKIKNKQTRFNRITTEIGNAYNAVVDLNVLKNDGSLGLDSIIIAKASKSTIDKMSTISSKIQAYLDDIYIHNICILCCSHGSLIIHFTLLYMASTLDSRYFQKIFTKLRIITYGSPRYLNKNLFNIFGNALSNKNNLNKNLFNISGNELSNKNNLNNNNTLAPIGCSAIKSIPYIINCYHVNDKLLPTFKSILPSYFHFPDFKNITKTFTKEEHFKYDTTNSLLYVNNTNNYYVENNTVYNYSNNNNISIVSNELNRDIQIYDSKSGKFIIVDPSELFPYLDAKFTRHYGNYHVDINVLYPLFSNSILLNLQMSFYHDDEDIDLYYPNLICYNKNTIGWRTYKKPRRPTTGGKNKKFINKNVKPFLKPSVKPYVKPSLKPSLKNKT